MTDKAKILAEIDRLRKNLPWGGSAAQLSFECNCKNEAYTEIEKFINSLPEEHVSPCVECASISEGCKEICYDYNKWVRDNHKEEPVSGELKEAAIEICSKILKGETVVIDGYEYVVLSDAEECFNVGAKWQKANLWKPADGDDLPEIDREVIALLDNGKVVFAHRPPEYWDGKDIVTGKVTRYYPKTYDKGGWNIPNVKYWLDCSIPKEIEL